MKKFENYVSHLRVLERANGKDLNDEFIIGGILNKFFLQFELGWKVLKEFLLYEGCSAAASGSARTIIKEAYAVYPFFNGDMWLQMLKDRNDTTHIYDKDLSIKMVDRILKEYIPEFQKLEKELITCYSDILDTL